MPALVLFRRRWLVSGDDLCFPALQLASFHVAWLVTLAIWLSQVSFVSDSCASKPYYVGVVGSMLGTCAASVVLEPAIAWYASRGGMFETKKRSPVLQWCIYADLLMSAFRVCITGYGTHVLYAYPSGCLAEVGRTPSLSFSLQDSYRAMVWSMWAMIGGLTCFCILVYNWFPDFDDRSAWVRQFQYWSNWFCCVSGSRREVRESFRRLGEMFGMMFGHIDLVPSDVVVIFGCAMLRQRMSRLEEAMMIDEGGERGVDVGSGGSKGSEVGVYGAGDLEKGRLGHLRPVKSIKATCPQTVDQATVEDVAYYMRYAFAAYGWMLFVWDKPGSGLVNLCCGNSCRMCVDCLRCRSGAPSPRNGKYMNREAILKTSRLHPGDLLHVQLEGDSRDVLPYFIGLDHAKKKLIIAIRGSLSFDDVVRDLKIEPASLDAWLAGRAGGAGGALASSASSASSAAGSSSAYTSRHASASLTPPGPVHAHKHADTADTDPGTFLAHRGIFEAAKATLASIERTGMLEKHLDRRTGLHRDYDILICGHSLGAGCAFLVGLYLRQSHPTLRCISFSPPGGIVSRNAASEATEWCISTACGKEWIPRLTLATIEQMRDEMVHIGIHCRMSKAKLILSWLTNYLWADDDVFYSDENLPEENAAWRRKYEESVSAPDELREHLRPALDFIPPGKILYLKPTGKFRGARRPDKSRRAIIQREFVCEWTSGADLVHNGILLSGRMMKDHFPDVSFAILKVLSGKDSRRGYIDDDGW